MYKVLIVDDEPIICEGLKRSVRWQDFNCEVVGTAENGLEGLDKMRELKPSKMDEIEEAISAMTDNLRSSGNMGAQIIDNLWDMQNEEDRYLYETFIKNKPEGKNGTEAKPRGSEANSYVIRKALQYILHNYTGKLGLTDVSEACFVSSWHLSKLLNQYTGRGFFEIINMIRLDEAKRLLTDTGERIADISEKVGFQDVAHFSRIFKTYIGMSPKDYRSLNARLMKN